MSVLLEARPYRPFKSSEEYLVAMKEDLAEWLNALYPELRISLDNFMDRLDTGVALCKHANNVRKSAGEYVARRQARKIMTRSITSSLAMPMSQLSDVAFLPNAKAGTFFARDNVSNFISWCRNSLGIIECLLFETDDLIMRKNEKHVILCLLEVARRGAKFGMLAPMLVQMERQIDREIAADNKAANNATNNSGTNGDSNGHNNHLHHHHDDDDDDADDEDEYADINQQEPCLIYGPQPQIVTNDLKSLDEMVRDLVERCTCPTQFPMIRVSEGKYRIGDTKVLIFVRILRSHVMVRVGGGWDTLSHYLDKHDPCRCRTSHRSMISAKLIQKAGGSFDLGSAQVHYERSPPRTRRSSASSVGSCAGTVQQPTTQQQQQQQQQQSHQLQTPRSSSAMGNRSRSPTPHQSFRQLGQDLKQDHRSPSPTPQSKFLSSPVRRQLSDLGNAQRSRSPTPKNDSASASPAKSVGPSARLADPVRKALHEQIRQIKHTGSSEIYDNRHLEDCQDPKKELDQETREKVPLSEEFTKRYVVEGGVARRAFEREETPKYEATIYSYKCGGGPESSAGSSPIPSPPEVKEEQRTTAEDLFVKESSQQYSKSVHADGEHSDNGSEVSDEGYRSLGAVQPVITSVTTPNQQQQHDGINGHVDSHKETSKPKNNSGEEPLRSCVETDSIETGLRKTTTSGGPISSPASSLSPVGSSGIRSSGSGSRSASAGSNSHTLSGERTPRGSSIARENSNLSRCSSDSRTPREGNSSPEGSPLKRMAGARGSMRKPPAPPAASLSKASGLSRTSQQMYCEGSPRLDKNISNCNGNNGNSNTWNGRQARQRPALTNETFVKPSNSFRSANPIKSSSPTGFSRKNPARQSLPRLGSSGGSSGGGSGTIPAVQYDRNGRRIKSSTSTSLQTSPTKIANPLLEQILQKMAHLRDDKEVVEKLQGLIRDYQGQGAEGDNDPATTADPTLEFTRAWIDGNGTVALPQEVQQVASPRKDPKPPSERGTGFSRIPAPVYKRPMSVASDSL